MGVQTKKSGFRGLKSVKFGEKQWKNEKLLLKGGEDVGGGKLRDEILLMSAIPYHT